MPAVKEKTATVSNIVLEISGKKIELTIEQGESLFEALKALFGEKEVKVIEREKHVYRDYDWPWRRSYWTNASHSLRASYNKETQTMLCKVE